MQQFLKRLVVYPLIVFPLAVVWHVVLFEQLYIDVGYFSREPSFLLGFLTILIQGVVLAYLYPLVFRGGSPMSEGLRFGMVTGVFLWTSHVLAYAAKHALESVPVFIGMETAYIFLQSLLVGAAIGLAHGTGSSVSVDGRQEA